MFSALDFVNINVEKINCTMQIITIQNRLLYWYADNKRDLPFRKNKDPYLIWISEVMLQQTKMKTMIPYFNKWIDLYPTLKKVAETELSDLLKLWEGLGYYSRCRNFHKATIILNRDNNGLIPKDWHTFRSLPGIGDYTASAVFSIAYNLPYVVIDVNVKRVMSRVLGLQNLSNKNHLIILNNLKEWICKKHPGDFNQAMMELGALVCTPQKPSCYACPIKTNCIAFIKGSPELYPYKKKKIIKPHFITVGGLIWRKNRFYIQKRNISSMLGGLWEFPSVKVKKNESLKTALKKLIKKEFGIVPIIKKKIGTIEHSYSHFSITFHGYHCKEDGIYFESKTEHEWIKLKDIDSFAFPKANHKIFNLI